jgi:hypothetical protein
MRRVRRWSESGGAGRNAQPRVEIAFACDVADDGGGSTGDERLAVRFEGGSGRTLACSARPAPVIPDSWFVLKFGVALVFGHQAAFGWRVGGAASLARAGSSHLGSLRLASMLQHGSEETL